MNKNDLDLLRAKMDAAGMPLTAQSLKNKHPRTLIYGYTRTHGSSHYFLTSKDTNQSTFHLYLTDHGTFQQVTYDSDNLLVSSQECDTITAMNVRSYLPNKRIYPERSDVEFCGLLLDQRLVTNLPFTTFSSEQIQDCHFYGRLLADVVPYDLEARSVLIEMVPEDFGADGWANYITDAKRHILAVAATAVGLHLDGKNTEATRRINAIPQSIVHLIRENAELFGDSINEKETAAEIRKMEDPLTTRALLAKIQFAIAVHAMKLLSETEDQKAELTRPSP